MKINVSKLFLACLLSQSLLGVSAQVDIAPRPELLDAPFTAKDLENFKSPPKVFYPETWFHFIRNWDSTGMNWRQCVERRNRR